MAFLRGAQCIVDADRHGVEPCQPQRRGRSSILQANSLSDPGSDGRRPLQDVSGVVENLFCSVLSTDWRQALHQSGWSLCRVPWSLARFLQHRDPNSFFGFKRWRFYVRGLFCTHDHFSRRAKCPASLLQEGGIVTSTRYLVGSFSRSFLCQDSWFFLSTAQLVALAEIVCCSQRTAFSEGPGCM